MELKIVNKRFDSQIIDAVSEIATRLGDDAIFCGSMVLKMYGLLDRMVKDLDVITKSCMYGTEQAESLLLRENSGRFSIKGSEVLCVHGGTKVGISVDYFWLNDWTKLAHKVDVVDWYDGIKIQVQDVNEIIAAKRAYIDSGQEMYSSKHERDLELIMNRLINYD